MTVEATSPALIEKVRSAISDGSGQYRIVDLRPGTYTVSFSLTGFNTFQRTGIELTGTFTATVNAEMRLGSLEETITVTGEPPVVDVQSANRQRVLTKDVFDAIPGGRSHLDAAALVPGLQVNVSGTRGTLADVGGTNNLQNMTLTMHGGRSFDTRLMVDGIRVGNAGSGGEFTNYVPDIGSTHGEPDLRVGKPGVPRVDGCQRQLQPGLRSQQLSRAGSASEWRRFLRHDLGPELRWHPPEHAVRS